MRRKLHPLSVHLGIAAANMQGINQFTSKMNAALSHEDAVHMMRGIQSYQGSTHEPKQGPVQKAWKGNGATLLKTPQNNKSKDPSLILIPSLINKSDIFNISRKHSMLHWCQENGIETYLFDWGALDAEATIESIINEKLKPALQYVKQETAQNPDVLGYCMGGTILLDQYDTLKNTLGNIVLLAAPWNFHDADAELAKHARIWTPYALPSTERHGYLPAEWIQALFASIDPNGAAQKFIKFAKMDQNSEEAKLFIAVEDWLNDGVDIPRSIAQHCIENWFVKNQLYERKKTEIHQHVLIAASKKDKLVPYSCAASVEQGIHAKSLERIAPESGHIGLIAGKNAKEKVWKKILDWIKEKA